MRAPPRLPERVLALLIRDSSWRESMLGDLAEEFSTMTDRIGSSEARRWYWRQAAGVAVHRLISGAGVRTYSRRPAPEQQEPRAGIAGILWHDLKHAWRTVVHQPALSATVLVVLAVALAANATTFAIVDALVLRPFRYPGVARATLITSTGHDRFFDRESVAPGDFLDWRDQTGDVLDRLAAIEWWDPSYTRSGPPQQLSGFRVSPALFEILGTPAELGRPLIDADTESSTPAVVLGHGYWQRQFAGRTDVLGTTLRLDGVVHRVVGVMPSDFRVPYGADVWAPLRLAPDARADRTQGRLMVVGQLHDGITVGAAEHRLQAILAQQKRTFPETYVHREVAVRSFMDGFRDPGSGPFLAVWQVAAFLLLLVACANVVNLLLARNTEREREFAVRLALGASSRRIAWQLFLEGLILAGSAAVIAVPLSLASLGATRAAMPDAIVRFVGGWPYLRLEPRTFVVTAAFAVGATVLFAMVPAWKAGRQSVTAGLRQGGRLAGSSRSRQRGRAALATAQIALTLALLAGAGHSLSALYRVTEGPLGFQPSGVLVARLTLQEQRYSDPQARRQFVDRVLARLRALPAVTSAGVTNIVPYGGSNASTSFWPEDVPPRLGDAVDVDLRCVTPDTVSLMKVALVSGRLLQASDRSDAPPVALVSQSLVRRFWPGQNAIGKRFRVRSDEPLITVVGVVGDVTHDWLTGSRKPTLYRPFDQEPLHSVVLLLRTVPDPLQLAPDVRSALLAEDPDQPLLDVRSMRRVVEDGTVGLRIASRGLAVMAAVSFLLSTIGLYGLMSFLTGLRTREIGVRMALGASKWQVIRLTGTTALSLTTFGVGVGLVLAYAVGRLLEMQLFGVVTGSLTLAVGLAALLAVVSVLASYVPARRAAMVDPTTALRAE